MIGGEAMYSPEGTVLGKSWYDSGLNGIKCRGLVGKQKISHDHEANNIFSRRFKTLFDAAPVSYILLDSESVIIDANQAALALLGGAWGKVGITSMLTLVGRCNESIFLDYLRKCKSSDHAHEIELTLNYGHGSFEAQLLTRRLTRDGSYFATIILDVSERKQIENEFLKCDRLNFAGRLTTAIAHEIRNPLTVVLGYLLLLRRKDEFASFQDRFNLMIDEVDRINKIVSQFLLLGNNRYIEPVVTNLNEIIELLYPTLIAEANLGANKVVLDLVGDATSITVAVGDIQHLILKLAQNGLQAMSKGQLTIRTILDKDGVVLVVQDQGPGIPLELQNQIGTPFFTTRNNALGLGLAICYSISERNKAKINFETSSCGTKFYVRFGISQ